MSSILPQHHILKLSKYSRFNFLSVQVSEPYVIHYFKEEQRRRKPDKVNLILCKILIEFQEGGKM